MALISHFFTRGLAPLLALLLTLPAWADPPGRVGRLADLQGQVWLYSPEAGEWVSATRNRPLTSGDRVSTDRDAKAELKIGSSTLRLDGSSELEVLQLDDDIVRVQLHSGSLAARLRTREAAREFELLTADGRFKPNSAGRYRFDHFDDTSHVTAWSGQVLFEGRDNAVTVTSGQRAEIWNDKRTQYTLTEPVRDAFADFVAARDRADERSASARYVSPEMTGVEDLDRHGRWETTPEYGALWIPRSVAPGWAPYQVGHWAWVAPWGWTWIDDAPWGFAPFHYGRWVHVRNNWCWAPGTYVARPVYAPALVAWVGGPRVSVSVSIGSAPTVGWFPLGPREVYVPSYRSSPSYVRNVNIAHVTNISNVTNIINSPNTVVQQTNYINRGVPGAVAMVPSTVLSGRQPVGPALVRLTDPRIARGNVQERLPEPHAAAPTLAAAPVEAPVARRRGDEARDPREPRELRGGRGGREGWVGPGPRPLSPTPMTPPAAAAPVPNGTTPVAPAQPMGPPRTAAPVVAPAPPVARAMPPTPPAPPVALAPPVARVTPPAPVSVLTPPTAVAPAPQATRPHREPDERQRIPAHERETRQAPGVPRPPAAPPQVAAPAALPAPPVAQHAPQARAPEHPGERRHEGAEREERRADNRGENRRENRP